MTHLLTLAGFLLASPIAADDSTAITQDYVQESQPPSARHFVASAYSSLGYYSTDTRSRSASGYLTMSNGWKDYYTLGFAPLWLVRDDLGGKYYSQELVTARGSWLIDYRVNLTAFYGYLHEGAIANYSSAAVFHFAGGTGSYWFSPTENAGAGVLLSASAKKIQSEAVRGFFSLHIADGVWATSTATFSKAKWTPSLFVFRQSVSVPLGGDNYIMASVDFGRRAFYFDDDLLLVYNQREVQVGHYLVNGTIRLFGEFYAIPSFEYNKFDGYNVAYGSIGFRIVY